MLSSNLAVASSPSLLQCAISPAPTRTGSPLLSAGTSVLAGTLVLVRAGVGVKIGVEVEAGVRVGTSMVAEAVIASAEGMQPASKKLIIMIYKNFTEFSLPIAKVCEALE